MVSTPPKSGGSPAEEAWRRWAEENITGLIQGDIVRDTRVKAVIQAATNVGNSAANAAAAANTAIDSASGIAPTNRVARPLTERGYWIEVTTGKRKVWTGDGIASTASNASAVVGGIMLTTSSDMGAEIDLTPLLQLPASGRLRIGAQVEAGSVNAMLQVTVRDAAGQPIEGITQPEPIPGTGATIKLPKPATGVGYYTVKAYLPADSGSTVLIAAEVFEVIGSGTGMNIGPDGISVEDPSGDKTIEFNPSAPLLYAPTPPELASSAGSVAVRWNGSLTLIAQPPAYFSYVRAEEAEASTGPWSRVGQALNKAGDIITRPPVGSVRWYRLIAVDTMNRESAPSAPASITVLGVSTADLDDAINDAIDQANTDASEAKGAAAAAQTAAGNAQTSADAKNRVWYQTSAPSGTGHKVGDTWFDTDDGNRIHRWDGGKWEPVLAGSEAIADLAITNAKIANLDAAKITSGYLDVANRIKAGSISVQQLLVTDFQNYFNDPLFASAGGYSPWTVVNGGIEKSGTGTQNGQYFASTEFPATPGDQFTITATRTDLVGSIGGASIYLQRRNSAGAWAYFALALSMPGAGTSTASFAVPADTTALRLGFYTESDMTSATKVRITDVNIRRKVAGELIVDGSVLAKHVTMDEAWAAKLWANQANIGKILVDYLEPNAGQKINITANDGLRVVAGQAGDALAQATEAKGIAGGAGTAATYAAAQAKIAQDAAAAAADDAKRQRSVFDFNDAGLTISQTGSVYSLKLTNGGISINQGATAVSLWDAGQMVVDKLVGSEVVLANHKIDSRGTRTIFRSM